VSHTITAANRALVRPEQIGARCEPGGGVSLGVSGMAAVLDTNRGAPCERSFDS
jgi:hypothetical protein